MTKILYVFGSDYAASEFDNLVEAGKVTAKELWDKAADEDTCEYSENDTWFEYQAMIFEDIDPDFVAFVTYDLVDYDASKTANIYIVE